jgi:hypothetical protein
MNCYFQGVLQAINPKRTPNREQYDIIQPTQAFGDNKVKDVRGKKPPSTSFYFTKKQMT